MNPNIHLCDKCYINAKCNGDFLRIEREVKLYYCFHERQKIISQYNILCHQQIQMKAQFSNDSKTPRNGQTLGKELLETSKEEQ